MSFLFTVDTLRHAVILTFDLERLKCISYHVFNDWILESDCQKERKKSKDGDKRYKKLSYRREIALHGALI